MTPEEIRARFPILGHTTYLNSCSLGALSIDAAERLQDFMELWNTRGAAAWYDAWLPLLGELREGVAGLLGASAREIALLPSTSAALSVVAESVDYRTRNRVVTTELDFPTLLHQWRAKPEVELVVLRSPDGVSIHPDQFADAVDERTAFLATSHVFFTTGFRQDLARLAEVARQAGAISLIDGYQGAGQVEVDVRRCGVDVYTAGPLKWLCGGPGLAYLYVRGELAGRWEPRITSWLAQDNPFDFNPDDFRRRSDAGRFELGTPSLATVHTALGGQSVLERVGMSRVESRNRALTGRLIGGLEAAGFTLKVAPSPEERTAIVMVAHPGPAAAVAALEQAGIIVDHRPGHVRVSPHFYNTEAEMDRFVEVLERLPR